MSRKTSGMNVINFKKVESSNYFKKVKTPHNLKNKNPRVSTRKGTEESGVRMTMMSKDDGNDDREDDENVEDDVEDGRRNDEDGEVDDGDNDYKDCGDGYEDYEGYEDYRYGYEDY